MRYIDASVSVNASGQVVPISVFIRYLLDTDDRFNKNGVGIRAAARIEAIIKVEPAPAYFAIEEADWGFLGDAAEAPTKGYPLSPARGCTVFVNTIQNAPVQDPTPKELPA